VDISECYSPDTAINGHVRGTRVALDFFGATLLFAPIASSIRKGGPFSSGDIIKVMDEIDVTRTSGRQIYHMNASGCCVEAH